MRQKLCRKVANKVFTFAGVVIGVGFTLVALAMGAKPRCIDGSNDPIF